MRLKAALIGYESADRASAIGLAGSQPGEPYGCPGPSLVATAASSRFPSGLGSLSDALSLPKELLEALPWLGSVLCPNHFGGVLRQVHAA
jgi:hypothetical protein